MRRVATVTENGNPLSPVGIARKIVKGAVGGLIVVAGIVMLITPGPGIVAILVGLGILGTEFPSARRALDKIREKARLRKPDEGDSLP